ncbi:hypothetical protein JAAARDRAFT_32043 [Jaapia argillacea MUCL 33604]|uniref:Carbohydrate-binding module family 19 domain-containing protein n=1 Tax=Jaapia argillacea MUCL 33604 TaxID=933084 RepID=A0A067Q1U9_9AGAM|nr:hypothetical protein JAAARDRAFT_32043 [Jaapia argillacea MUCL 33604]
MLLPTLLSTFFLLASSTPIPARPIIHLQNGLAAQSLNAHFSTLTAQSTCTPSIHSDPVCLGGQLAKCVDGKYKVMGCDSGTTCFALPLVNTPGTRVACTTLSDARSRIKATGAKGGMSTTTIISKPRPQSPPACLSKLKLQRRFSLTPLLSLSLPIHLPFFSSSNLTPPPPPSSLAQTWHDLCSSTSFVGDEDENACKTLTFQNLTTALLPSSNPCAQQDLADDMITYSKSSSITPTQKHALVSFALTYRTYPRNALSSPSSDSMDTGVKGGSQMVMQSYVGRGVVLSSPYCQKAPVNAELVGVVNGQGGEGVRVDPGLFLGVGEEVFAFGERGSCPFGMNSDVGSCECR